ncbi:MAG: hypothetical protein OEQ28_04600, partial [Acidobacteriota bacterium]|nr:hypothetical protein [Acidobacteriota bacterium]
MLLTDIGDTQTHPESAGRSFRRQISTTGVGLEFGVGLGVGVGTGVGVVGSGVGVIAGVPTGAPEPGKTVTIGSISAVVLMLPTVGFANVSGVSPNWYILTVPVGEMETIYAFSRDAV